ncbi:hypothetical protein G6O69_06650 [Pseudenhygromyxa sp. WMMC2535]|uniref:ComF family protein n=1 Tax=Pseudenhygromyxa sp. WMMC2535 TaxID=2712867 RepID=UPI0015963B1B|nr:hypothetical protein [Pseudenhygromyxa sp. WMMC2535]NVB37505.1 hypothetical protein [Pseudenhygromyxa sp. WMMC2535]
MYEALRTPALRRHDKQRTRAKYGGLPAPREVLDAACSALRDPDGVFAGISFDALCSMPSTRSGRFVADFAASLAAALELPLIELEKHRETRQQKNFRSRLLKQRNVQGAFRLPPDVSIPTRVLLIDDVWDSGESMKEAARLLRPAQVFPLTMAKTRHIGGT